MRSSRGSTESDEIGPERSFLVYLSEDKSMKHLELSECSCHIRSGGALKHRDPAAADRTRRVPWLEVRQHVTDTNRLDGFGATVQEKEAMLGARVLLTFLRAFRCAGYGPS